ncbi:MAG: amino acid permease [Candidatus Marinimicrobia bacterium]|jgi:APA family basic amino acid/polyamine antiporter|nr:amino acid permease [Candidatus Neomarinimicrobiota bacterium]MDP6276159.1 amino acid permease [Candidatus Neomarinimicrobiota bacterium]MDP7330539.1 amino acid permease [Candidatus Neomarinimicrobiota bacterium]MDP7437556.1 amino acid permease [Candidatus Neomarinimicrobiota bacterium]|tara:strand:+ start:1971 stop:3296 length:1326 start_codon:yes stop_codon:yes gene_type:complete
MESVFQNIKLKRVLSLMDATMINAGGIIGSGIFMVPATVALYTMSSSLFFLVWIFGGIVSLFGALSVAELGAAMPKAGGQYVYLSEAYGPVWGYLYGWAAVAVINTASIAAVGVAFSEYLGFFIPMSTLSIQLIAVLMIIILTIINIIDVKSGAQFQNLFTLTKLAAIFGIIVLGLSLDGGSASNLEPLFTENSFSTLIGSLGLAMVAVLWTFDGWIFVTYVAGEIKDPGRNIPLSIILCMIIVVSVYLALNFVLVYILGFNGMIGSDLVMSDAASVFLGDVGATIVTIIILISLIGANNGFVLTSARINYAMAKDGLFFKQAGTIHSTFQSPTNALIIQCVWACILTFTGTFNQLITYIIFASWIFYGMSAGAVIVLRKKRPDLDRPYKTPFYPWIPAIFILFSIFLTINTILEAPRDAAIGTAIILAGLPLYFYWKKHD